MKKFLLIINLCSAADITTTHIALKQGGRELFFPTQNRWVIHGINVGQMFTWNKTLPKLAKKHETETKIMATAIAAGKCFGAAFNTYQLSK